ncbi:hypothetical protein SEUCBS139899_009893 [Sporothrix eucalyptigena]|uniref:Uncharacterized protein n=1 Tax=Sporothrix eucalyptigena TaxID=1812306 RepID=A0ABP0CYK3_9PEZI
MARLRANPLRSPSSPRSQSSLGPDSRSDSRESTALPACDIFNTTFLLYRASPLFVGADGLSDGRLQALEAQLRDTLAGGVVRGIEVGSDEDGDRDMVNAGTLEAVSVKWFSAHNVVSTPRPALQVTLQYENAQCMAVLLPPPETSKAAAKAYARPDSAFVNLPLLLFRMPVPLKDTVSLAKAPAL